MNIVCLDLEGVLVPEIWIAFAKASGIPELTRTTRDEPDYDKLMKWRIGILKEHNLGLNEIRAIIEASGKDIDLEIDGGVTAENVEEIKTAGANVIVAGSTVFKAEDRAEIIAKLKA